MTYAKRGTAMAETAIVLTVALLVIFGIMQIGFWGFNQATSEGAAFVAAHSASINATGTQATDQSYGLSVANLAFPSITSGQLFLTYPTSNSIQVIVQKTVGLPIAFPGALSTASVRGGDIEPILADGADPTSTNGGISVQATMVNYCYFQNKNKSACSSRSIYIAQYDDIYGKGNGKNGQFAEWNCRPGMYPTYGSSYFPTAYPTTGGYNSVWDPGSSSNFGGSTKTYTPNEATLYSMDTTPNQWGKQSSC